MINRGLEFNRQQDFHPCMLSSFDFSFILVINCQVSDPRNLFHYSFDQLPAEPIFNVLTFGEVVYDKTDGFKVPFRFIFLLFDFSFV